ncbi:MAG: efflux RND transporter permease subunit [Deltaproteobacteria bacterium]|nr:efflux RND transporter permease subunit [Deltaproteobacteria bacterium]
MINKLIDWSLRNRFLVIVLTLLLVGIGIRSLSQLPIDAVPDVTNVQVQILTNSPALGPEEVEKFITFPVEAAMSGLPDIEEIRSVSKFGLSVVTVVFKDKVDLYFARRLVMERLSVARDQIPSEYGSPEMGPISTGLGEIYQFEVKGTDYSLMELRTILDWFVAYQLRSVPGVVEVNTFGGELKTYEVALDPSKLVAYQIPITNVYESLEENNANAGGGYIAKESEQYLIRGEGLVKSIEDIKNIVVKTTQEGTPIYVKNLGEVHLAPMIRQGAVTRDGRGEAVTGIVMMLYGENSRVVVNRIKDKIEEIKKTLPEGVTIDTFYDRTDLIQKTINTVSKNLFEGGILVIIVLFLLLGNFRGGLIVASSIPLSMLFAFIAMNFAKISGNLMSLGAIDFGLIVDGSVVMIENVIRVISEKKEKVSNRMVSIREAAFEVGRPIVFAVGIIIIVYLPIMTLTGIEGKMFKPMAFTVVFALAGSLLLSLTLMPVMASGLLGKNIQEKDTFLIRWAKKVYYPSLEWVLKHRLKTVGTAGGIFIVSIILIPFLGAEFVPKLDEGAVALQAWRIPSVSLEESIKQTSKVEKVLKKFPEVVTVVSKTGRAEIATDPMGVEISDIFVILKPRSQWETAETKEALVEKMDEALKEQVPGNMFSYSQPIELRVSELISGVRSDVAVKIYGEDLETLKKLGDQIVGVMGQVNGAADVKAEQVAGLPVLRARVDREKIARFGLNVKDVLETLRAIGGRSVGEVLEGQKRFTFQVRLQANYRNDPHKIQNLPILAPSGKMLPLGEVAELVIEEGPAQISRENIQRRLTVESNVRGRDLAGYVAEAKEAIAQQVKIPPGYTLEWGGQFENLQAASSRLMIVVPLALLLIFVLLYSSFGSAKIAILIYLNVPVAATGGILALFARGLPFSISAGVGFIALFGIAVLNGVVLMTYILKKRSEGLNAMDAAMEGAKVRLRPVLMTAVTDALGFMPMAFSTSAGAEIQRPLATVVIGGLVTSTLLTLLVLPTIYSWFEKKEEEIEI